jgi:hypothetical protein
MVDWTEYIGVYYVVATFETGTTPADYEMIADCIAHYALRGYGVHSYNTMVTTGGTKTVHILIFEGRESKNP